jgi:proteasome lid subunit RPN8/RPN11
MTGTKTVGDGTAATTLHLPQEARRQLAAWVAEGYPHEVCGLLVGRVDGERVAVERVAKARNLNHERAHDRYQLDPEDFLAVDREARADDLEIVGIWHSHPDCPARPSVTDLEAAWEGWSYLILEAAGGETVDHRSWRLHGEVFLEERVIST